jgi:hypothetical protein
VGAQEPSDQSSDFSAQTFLVNQIMNRLATTMLVRIMAVTNSGGVSPVGFCDVQPLVNQVDGAGNPTPHGTIHNLPYMRVQGGTNAVIIDPVVGDIGVAVFCSRDISAVKRQKQAANPGSTRKFDWADGLYLGGFLNGTPVQYVQFTASGVAVRSPSQITLDAPIISVTGTIQAAGELIRGYGTGDQVAVGTHRHGTGTNASGTVPPTPGT